MGAEPVLLQPLPNSVAQREGYQPLQAHINETTGTALGSAEIPVEAAFEPQVGEVFQFRTQLMTDAYGRAIDWTPFPTERQATQVRGRVRLPAGGWYRLEVRQLVNETVTGAAAVERIGVGEVIVIAGQSYADGSNDELQKVDEPQGRVVAYDVVQKSWRIANDPQPNIVQGGTIWPACGDLLVPMIRVPVGFVNAAVGGTSSRQWLPGTTLFERLKVAGAALPRFRAVLWQQGESDVIENVSTEQYVRNLTLIREELTKTWGFEAPWLLAKSTLHPTVYVKPVEEGRIRDAIQKLYSLPGFFPGPDTDVLGGENRGGLNSKRHFSPIGQRRAALLWFNALWNELHREKAILNNPKT